MGSTYTDEDLFSRYYAATLDARQAAEMVAVHRESYPLPDPAADDWAAMSATDRDAATLAAIKRAAASSDASEKEALVALALDGARARVETAKGKR